MAPFESEFFAQYSENPTIPENKTVAHSYLLAGTGRWCLNSLATVIGNTEYSNLKHNIADDIYSKRYVKEIFASNFK